MCISYCKGPPQYSIYLFYLLFRYPLGLYHDDPKTARRLQQSTWIDSIILEFPSAKFSLGQVDYNRWADIRVTVFNVGMKDSRKVLDSRECIGQGDLPESEKKCQDKYYVNGLEKFCNCTPFTYRSLSTHRGLPYCTRRTYAENSSCIRKVADYVTKAKCQPCITVKNIYNTVITPMPDEGRNRTCRVFISFLVDTASYYFIFEDRFQLRVSQLVAQIGGDIGVYTGFSLFALWQFLMFYYFHHKEQLGLQRQGSVKAPATKPQKKKEAAWNSNSWFQIFMCHLQEGGGSNNAKCKIDNRKQFDQLLESAAENKKLLAAMSKNLTELVKRQRRLEKAVRAIQKKKAGD